MRSRHVGSECCHSPGDWWVSKRTQQGSRPRGFSSENSPDRDADAVRRAEGSTRAPVYGKGGPGSPESLDRGMLPRGFSRNPRELLIFLPHREERLSHREVRDPKGDRRDTEGCRAVLRTHSTDESGEPQGFRKERPRYPLAGRGKQADVSAEGNIDGTQNPILYVHETRQNS
jgi:hypothetical protein